MERNTYEHASQPESPVQQHGTHRPEIEKCPDVPAAPPRRALAVIGIFLSVLILGGVVTFILRAHDERVLANTTDREAIPYVAVVSPTPEEADQDLALPSTLQAFKESPIYARTSGYL